MMKSYARNYKRSPYKNILYMVFEMMRAPFGDKTASLRTVIRVSSDESFLLLAVFAWCNLINQLTASRVLNILATPSLYNILFFHIIHLVTVFLTDSVEVSYLSIRSVPSCLIIGLFLVFQGDSDSIIGPFFLVFWSPSWWDILIVYQILTLFTNYSYHITGIDMSSPTVHIYDTLWMYAHENIFDSFKNFLNLLSLE